MSNPCSKSETIIIVNRSPVPVVHQQRSTGCCCSSKVCGLCCAYFIPPLGVFWQFGCCSLEFVLCVILTCCGYVPVIIYACCIIAHDDGYEYEYTRI